MREGDEPFRKARENREVCREYIIIHLFVYFSICEVSGGEQREARREADTRKGTSSRDCRPSIELEPNQKYTILSVRLKTEKRPFVLSTLNTEELEPVQIM